MLSLNGKALMRLFFLMLDISVRYLRSVEYIKRKKETDFSISFRELGGSRTHNRLIRSQGLYPIELPVQLISSAKIRLFSYLSR